MKNTILKTTGLGLLMISITACNMNGASNPKDTAEFRQSRYEEVLKLQDFEACREEALELDSQARTRASSGAYLTSARVMDKCNADLGEAAEGIPRHQRMRLSALATLNYFRGGDIERARRTFEKFKNSYPGHDLYFAGGASFLATSEALLGRTKPYSYGEFAALNVNENVKSEMRRINHWKNK
jgi:hypothetical protein